MSTFSKMLSILDLFTADRPTMTTEEITAALGCTRPTGYRYIRELSQAGLLNRISGAYTLGSRIIELDYKIREFDPLLSASRLAIKSLQESLSCDALLMVYIGGKVTVTHHERGPDAISVSYGRGRNMPVFRGAGSKALVANLPRAEQQRLYEAQPEAAAGAGLGSSWPEVRRSFAAMRRAGYVVTFGELDRGNVGIGASITVPSGPPASIVLAFNAPRWEPLNQALVVELFMASKGQIEALLRDDHAPTALARAPLVAIASAARAKRRIKR
jgi:DNA-binding IclR family transcriptional regulator